MRRKRSKCVRISFKNIIIKSDTKNDAAGVERFWCKYCQVQDLFIYIYSCISKVESREAKQNQKKKRKKIYCIIITRMTSPSVPFHIQNVYLDSIQRTFMVKIAWIYLLSVSAKENVYDECGRLSVQWTVPKSWQQ